MASPILQMSSISYIALRIQASEVGLYALTFVINVLHSMSLQYIHIVLGIYSLFHSIAE